MNAFLSIIPASIQIITIVTAVSTLTSYADTYFYRASATGRINTEGIFINADSYFYIASATGRINTEGIFINMDTVTYTVSAISLSA